MSDGKQQRADRAPLAKAWILFITWFGCAVLIALHTREVGRYVALLDEVASRPAAERGTPLRQIVPIGHADAQMWVRLAVDAAEAGEARVRFTSADNAPRGREVHWSSAFLWLVRAAGALEKAFTGESTDRASERVLLWFNAPLLFGLIIAISWWTSRRAGVAGGVVVALALVGHPRLYEAFAPTNVDHHGLVAVAVLGLLLGAGFMGAGWIAVAPAEVAPRKAKHPRAPLPLVPASRAAAHRAAVISALCGAAGLWISAASVLPMIALIGAGGLLASRVGRVAPEHSGAQFDAGVWRLWGRVGAVASAVFYLIEYAPAHLGLRLEVNNPLWSLAWWGGAEVVALLAGEWKPGARLILPALAIAAAPLAIVAGGTATFAVQDPFVGALRHFVVEGQSLAAFTRRYGLGQWSQDLLSMLVIVPAAVTALRRRDEPRIVLGLLVLVALACVALACAEMRWLLHAALVESALLVAWLQLLPRRAQIGVALAVGVWLAGTAVYRIARDHAGNERRAVAAMDLLEPLYRDIAATLRASQPQGDIVLLSDPTASALISYFGRGKSIGTLYWENAAGLRAAAQMMTARRDDEAERLVRERGVTHIAIISTLNFIGEYTELLRGPVERAEVEKSFAVRLTRDPPRWLEPIPYRIPAELKPATPFVLLFKVAFDQTESEQLFHRAVVRAASGNPAAAEEALSEALAKAAPVDRFALCAGAAAEFFEYGLDAAAVRAYRRALELQPDPLAASTLAWILATSSDRTVRDGPAALALVEPLARQNPDDPTTLSAWAAACAETGRWADAIGAAEKALAAVRAAGDAPATTLLEKRLAAYRANQPWRE